MKIFSLEDVQKQFTQQPNPELWTAVIPAAGRGSRLGYDKPKILYPVAGRPIIDWLIDLLEPQCAKLIVILSPTGIEQVRPILEARLDNRFTIAIQSEPKGMADAIYQSVPELSTPYSLIIWGDQVAIQPHTINGVMRIQEGNSQTKMTLPIVERDNPYVHYQTDDSGQFTKVLERREGAAMPPKGQSDCGVFAFQTKALQKVFSEELKKGITLSQGTKEWNFLPMLPQFDAKGEGVHGLRLESLEETIGVNDKTDAAILEAYLQQRMEQSRENSNRKDKLKVVLFSGGSGTTSISDALLKYPDIDLTMLVNAYDDGKSTGLLRRFIPGMLGPSDIRKVVSSLLKQKPDRSSQALRKLLEYRLPNAISTEEALQILNQLTDWNRDKKIDHEMLEIREDLSLAQMRTFAYYLQSFLDYFKKNSKENPWFTFADNSLGNLIFGGCYLESNESFNQAIRNFSDFAEVDGVINITLGENLVLTAIKEDGSYLADEAAIVGPQDAARIEEIFLLPNYVDPNSPELRQNKDKKIAYLRSIETPPKLNPLADTALREADIIIYGPGTQHSSLYPSYLTLGVAEAIQANKQAEKIFIANIARDYDIQTADATTLVNGFMSNMSRKGTCTIKSQRLVTRFFFQKPEKAIEEAANYLPFQAGEFTYPLEKVVWIDLEGAKGKHSGGRTVSELLLIVEEHLRKRIRHVPHKVSIIVPVLNEEKTIKSVIDSLKDLHFPELGLEKEIIAVDGGSKDQTRAILQQEASIRAYEFKGEGGRGMAYRLGIEKARGEIIVFFPSDGEYSVEDIPRVVNPLLSQEFPVVFGSRAFRHDLTGTLQQVYGGKGPLFTLSKYGGMLLSILSLLLYQRYVSDPLTSLKGFNARIFRNVSWQRGGVDYDMELIAKIAKAKYPILEVPVSYKARSVKEGKKVTVSDGIKCLITLFRFAYYKPKPKGKKSVVGSYSLQTEAQKSVANEQRM